MEIALLCGKKGDLSAAVFARFKNLAQYLGRCFITNHYWPHGFCVCWRNGIGFLAQRRKNAIKHKVICLRMIRIPNNVCSPGFLRRGGAEIADLPTCYARNLAHQCGQGRWVYICLKSHFAYQGFMTGKRSAFGHPALCAAEI